MESDSQNTDLASATEPAHTPTITWECLFTRTLALMTLGAPVLYLMGIAYDQGYQSVFQVPPVARAGGFHEMLTLGFFAVLHSVRIINNWMAEHWYIVAIAGVATGAIVAWELWRPTSWIDGTGARIRSRLKIHRHASKSVLTAGTSIFVFALPYVLIVFLSVLVSMPLVGYFVGKDVARINLARHAATCELAVKHPDRFQQCTTAKAPDGRRVSGYLIAVTPGYFAIAMNGRTQVLPLSGWEFETTYEAVPGSATL